jgi:hypothetical protein
MTRTFCGGCIAALLVAVPLAQQTPPRADFRFERSVQTQGPGPKRLPIDVTLLAGGRPFVGMPGGANGLADLRFFTPSGEELQYILVPNPSAEPVWRTAGTLAVAAVETRTRKTSGFEIDLGRPLAVDRFRIDGLPAPFLKRVRLEGSGDRERWTLLVNEGTVFDLPAEQLRRTELEFAPGAYRYLRLTWDDTRSGRVPRPQTAAAREVRARRPSPSLTAALVFERRPSEPGRSRFRVRLPGGRLPIAALDLDVGGGELLRAAAVFEGRLTGNEVVPVRLGGATLKRVVRSDATASALRVPIDAPVESQLDLVVDDGTNPPIDLRGVTAVFEPLPWIYLKSTGETALARYGNTSLEAPQYDLEAVRNTLKIGEVADATWGEAVARTAPESAGGPVPGLPTVGSELDADLFRYRRPIAPGDAGLVTVPLDAAALAHSRSPSFADTRVLDKDGRQVPYLVERASEPLSLDLPFERMSTRPASLPPDRTTSVYRVQLPQEGLPQPRLVLTTTARVFRRSVMVGVEHEPGRTERDRWFESLASTTWQHADQDTPTPALTLELRPLPGRDLLVVIEEGDNSPLPLQSMRLLLPASRLRLFRDRDTELQLVYGRDDLGPPRYDLALLAPQLIGIAATEVLPGAEQPRAQATTTLVSPRVFWGVLIAAVLVLVGLVVRLLRKSDLGSTAA